MATVFMNLDTGERQRKNKHLTDSVLCDTM